MHKFGSDPKVKKTLVRNCEKKIKPTSQKQVVHDVGSSSKENAVKSGSSMKENELDEPTLCSSEALARYLSEAKISAPPPRTNEDVNMGKSFANVTKKLNFHFNNSIYRNLIELNANVEDLKKKKDKRPLSSTSVKRDLEPNIDDFCEDTRDEDSLPDIPVMKPRFRAVKKVENGQLHKLVAQYENL